MGGQDRSSIPGKLKAWRSAKGLMLATVGLSIIVPAAVRAQSTAGANASTATTDASSGTPDIIVTAGKQEQYLSRVPEGISVVTGKQLDDRGAKSLADYTALTPGLSLQSAGATGFGFVEIRGISPQSVGATVATYIDDVPFSASSALTQSGEYTPDLDPSDLQRVEVLKGPQGTLYGASSLGGVIKYVTKGPNLDKTEIDTSESLDFLNNGQPGTELRASISTPLVTDTLGIRVSGFYRHDPGYIDQLGPTGLARDDANYGNSWGFRGALRWKPSSNFTLDLTGSIENSRYHGFSVIDLDPDTLQSLYGPKDSAYRALNEGFSVRTDLLAATAKWQTGLGTVTSVTSYSVQKPHNVNDITAFYSAPANQPQDPDALISYLHPAGSIGTHEDDQTTEELRFNSRRLGPVEFIAGGFYQHEKLSDDNNYLTYQPSGGVVDRSAPLLGVSDRTGTLSEYAGFINATLYLTDRLDVTGGFRHSHIDQVRDSDRYGPLFATSTQSTHLSFSENSDTYLGGVRWRPTDNLTIYGRAASGYRPGGGRTIPPGAPADFGSTYRSDSIWSYEAGVKFHGLGGKLTVDLDGFWIDWKNIQTLVFVGRFATDGNGGKARSRGAEFQGSYTPFRGLTVNANAAYTDARFTQDAPEIGVVDGQRIFQVPKWTATLDLEYRWALNDRWNAFVGGDYDYKSNQLDFTNYVLPANKFFNIRGGVDREHYKVNVFVKNLTNKRVFVGDSSGYFAGLPPFQPVINEPREFGIAFSQKF